MIVVLNASRDAIWSTFYAILDRSYSRGSLRNGCYWYPNPMGGANDLFLLNQQGNGYQESMDERYDLYPSQSSLFTKPAQVLCDLMSGKQETGATSCEVIYLTRGFPIQKPSQCA